MKQLTCEMCGSTDLLKQEGVFVCQTCGTKYSVEEAKKMMIEGTVEVSGTVKVDKSKETEALLDQAFALIKIGKFDAAIPMLNQAIAIDAKNARAYLGKILCEYKCKTTIDLSGLPSEKITGNVNYTLLLGCGDGAVSKELNDAIYANIETLLEHSKGILTHNIVQKIYSEGGDIVLPNSVIKIDAKTFFRIEKAFGKITVPNSVVDFAKGAFYFLNAESVVLPDSMIEIKEGCFEYAHIRNISIPGSVKKIGEGAFKRCSSLTNIKLPESLEEIGKAAFDSCKSLESISIPDSVKKIEEHAFDNCSKLTNIKLSESLEEIGKAAFSYCESLETIFIPDSVKRIGGSAFSGCKKLTEVKLPESLEEIGKAAFDGCESIESISMPASVKKIGEYVFGNCKGLKEVKLPESLTKIGEDAFLGCESLEKIVIPASVEKIENGAFCGCGNLKCATILNPNTNIGRFAFFDGTKIVIGREAEIPESEPNVYDTKVEGDTGGGCYVATAVYGSYDCPQVWTLRRFRDNTLGATWYGRAFVRTYYAISPTLVKWFGKANWFKGIWKPILDRMVNDLNESGVEDTPYDDRAW